MAAYTKYVFFAVFLSFLGVAVYDVLTNFEENGCQMTWMYEYPMYMKAKMGKTIAKKFPRYGLYLYGEGSYGERIKNFKLSGIPVLFIPGNAGSYRQVRSLGSVALRKAETFREGIHFNYFSVDLNEELSGLFGGVLQEQTEFVHTCIKYILGLYANAKHPPSSVVVVGHSMGGVIARGLFTLPDFDPQLVHTIITQATPHQPVIPLDYSINEYYTRVNNYWAENGNTTLEHVTVFSTGGGYRDVLVRTGLTSLAGVVSEERSVSSVSMSIPRAWVSTDHLCIVWCNEFVKVTKRAMFDLIDLDTKQISTDPEHRVQVFQHHFDTNPGHAYTSEQESTVDIDTKTKWEVKDQLQWSFTRDKVKKTRYLAVPTVQGMSFVATTTVPGDAWIVGCIDEDNSQSCVDGDNLSSLTRLVPPEKMRKRMILLSSEILLDYTHLLIKVPPTHSKVSIVAEQFNMTERQLSYQTPGFWATVLAYPLSLVVPSEVLPATQPGAMFYNISIVGLGNIWQAIRANIVATECDQPDIPVDVAEGSLMTMHVPWNKENTYSYAGPENNTNALSLKTMVARPLNYSDDEPSLLLLLNPSCKYSVSLLASLKETLGQIGRFCMSILPVFIVVNIMMAFGQQLYEPTGIKSFAESHGVYADNWRLVPWMSLFSFLLSREEISWMLVDAGIPRNDLTVLTEKRVAFGAMNILLYLISYTFVRVHAANLDIIFTAIGTVLRLNCNCCSSSIFSKLCSLIHSALLIGAFYLALFHCGAAALVVVLFVSMLKTIGAFTRESPSRQAQLTLVMLLLWLLILNGPSFIVWVQNLRFSPSLKTDPSKTSAALCCGVMLVSSLLPQDTASYGCLWARRLIHVTSMTALLYALESVYRLPFVICAGLVIHLLAQLHTAIRGPTKDTAQVSEDKSDGDNDKKIQ